MDEDNQKLNRLCFYYGRQNFSDWPYEEYLGAFCDTKKNYVVKLLVGIQDIRINDSSGANFVWCLTAVNDPDPLASFYVDIFALLGEKMWLRLSSPVNVLSDITKVSIKRLEGAETPGLYMGSSLYRCWKMGITLLELHTV